MSNVFNEMQVKKPDGSWFDLSHDHKMSLKMGKLVPTYVQECLPGDVFKMTSEAMFRMMPMIAPIMHKVDIYQHFWFVPNRIIWPGWEQFIYPNPELPSTPPAFPILDPNGLDVRPSTIGDYMGLPIGNYTLNSIDAPISALPFMAYQKIWANWYRDQNLEPMGDDVALQNGMQDSLTMAFLFQLRDRAWEHDYFTSCLPWAQKGEEVLLPYILDVVSAPTGDPWLVKSAAAPHDPVTVGNLEAVGLDGVLGVGGPAEPVILDPNGNLEIQNVTTTINDLRLAYTTQKWLELNARGGTRYTEAVRAHFGVFNGDARLQRPEYLGGNKSSLSISEVLQTSHSDVTPQGNMAGHGISVQGGKDFSYRCTEHGWIIGVLSIRPKTAYMQGLPRHFSKVDNLDFADPMFAYIGEQEVLNKELYFDFGGLPSENNGTFGYIPRYSEYRYNPSRVSGQMRDTLDFWHMARIFDDLPTLSAEFIRCNPTKRIFAVEDPEEDSIVAHIYHRIMAYRLLPKYGNPGSL